MTELATSVGIALLATVLAMWAIGPAASCTPELEPHQRLNLNRLVDREHLAADVRQIGRVARRYAGAGAADRGDGRMAQCEAKLDGQLETAHDLTAAQVRSATARER